MLSVPRCFAVATIADAEEGQGQGVWWGKEKDKKKKPDDKQYNHTEIFNFREATRRNWRTKYKNRMYPYLHFPFIKSIQLNLPVRTLQNSTNVTCNGKVLSVIYIIGSLMKIYSHWASFHYCTFFILIQMKSLSNFLGILSLVPFPCSKSALKICSYESSMSFRTL